MFIIFTLGTLKAVFDHISKRLKVVQKYVATRRIFHSLLGVWKRGKTWSFVFHLLHNTLTNIHLSGTRKHHRANVFIHTLS